MAPKRKANNNTKKRRPKADQPGTATTPTASPSKPNSANHSTQSTPNQQNHSSPTTPIHPTPNGSSQSDHPHNKHSADSDRSSKPSSTATPAGSQKSLPDHQPAKSNDLPSSVKSTASNADSAALAERSANLPQSNSNSNHHHSNSANETGRPTKSTKEQNSKQVSGTQRVQDSGGRDAENRPDPAVGPKTDTKKNQQASNKASTNNHSDHSRPASQQHQSPEDPAPVKVVVASDPAKNSQNGMIPKESDKNRFDQHKESEKASPVKSSPENDPARSLPSSGKKPAKHVKFTNATLADDQSSSDTSRSAHENHRKQGRLETAEEAAELHAKHKSIRREMSGAADQFDFDAQQRMYAGPGGGMVKKACHRRPVNGNSHPTEDQRASDEPVHELSPDRSSPASAEALSARSRDTMGFQHAQRCLQSIVEIQHLNAHPDELDPDLLQIYLSYFDQDQDGLLDPLDTWRAFRRLGFGLLWAVAATFTLHLFISPFIGMGSWLMPDVLGRCQLPLGHHLSGSSRSSINIDPHDISNINKDHPPDKVGPSALWKKTQEHMGAAEMTDPVGWIKFVIGWLIAISLTWPSDLSVKHDLINGVYNGELLFLVAQGVSS